MEDLIPVLIFIVVAGVNVVKHLAEKTAKAAPPQSTNGTPRKKSSPLEEFLEELSGKMGPQPRQQPELPKGYERPDYARQSRAYEAAKQQNKSTPTSAYQSAYAVPARPASITSDFAHRVSTVAVAVPKVAAKAATVKIPSQGMLIKGMSNMRVPMPPILKSSAGHIDYDLKDKKQLKQALISQMVFSKPRAYDTSFDNTVSQ